MAKGRCPIKRAVSNTRYRLKKYGLTLEQFMDKIDLQDGRCDICRCTPIERTNAFAVDHDHKTGKVRGILCTPCNSALGLLRDDAAIIDSAAEYIRKWNE